MFAAGKGQDIPEINGDEFEVGNSDDYGIYAPLKHQESIIISMEGNKFKLKITNMAANDDAPTVCKAEQSVEGVNDGAYADYGAVDYNAGQTITWTTTNKQMAIVCGSIATGGPTDPPPVAAAGDPPLYTDIAPATIPAPAFDKETVQQETYFEQTVSAMNGASCTTDKTALEAAYKTTLAAKVDDVHEDSLHVSLKCADAASGKFVVGIPRAVSAASTVTLNNGLTKADLTGASALTDVTITASTTDQ